MTAVDLSRDERAMPAKSVRDEVLREVREDCLREWQREFPEFNAERVKKWRGE